PWLRPRFGTWERPGFGSVQRPVVTCSMGACWRTPSWGDRRVFVQPGWRPRSLPTRPLVFAPRNVARFARVSPSVICDPLRSICYRNGHIDKTETDDFFGAAASRHADAVRDRAGPDAFVARPGLVCSRATRTCRPTPF